MLNVTSEIGRLRSVLMHEPGPEVDLMVPDMMHELLFDDVLFGERAREEHALLRRVMQLFGVETLEALTLLTETLENAQARSWLLDVVLVDIPRPIGARLRDASVEQLATMLTSGIRVEPGTPGIDPGQLFWLPPLANWCFQRDPQVVLHSGVVYCAMSSPARHLESFLSRAIFKFHPRFGGTPVLHDPLESSASESLFVDPRRPRLEGGDVTVMSRDIIAVGHSQRTGRNAIQSLARSLAKLENGPRWLMVVTLPQKRAYMHLDTVLTVVDRDACLVYPPVLVEGGNEPAQVAEIDLRSEDLEPVAKAGFFPAIKARGLDLRPILCGGDDIVRQQREQWTDGANVLAVAPGVITLYERNVGTAEELSRHGFDVVEAEDLVLGRERVQADKPRKLAILMPSHEISRARGGPHCLTHPLVRDDL